MNDISIRHFNSLTPEKFREILLGPQDIAARWLATAARHGITEAQLRYGQMLLHGTDIDHSADEALYWFKTVAASGHPMGMNMVGRCYENGWGTAVNMVVATYWFRLAAAADLDWGMYNYATSLALGRGVPADQASAFAWLEKAAGHGHAKSWNLLGGFHEDGCHVPANMQTAMDCYRHAAQKGDFRGQFNYARTLAYQGNIPDAILWLRKVPATATPSFMTKMREFLAAASQPGLRDLAL